MTANQDDMSNSKTVCAYWDGRCQAIAVADCEDISGIIMEWLKDGATVKTLPTEEAKDEFLKSLVRT